MLFLDYYVGGKTIMTQILDCIIKNHIALTAFDAMSLEAINLVNDVKNDNDSEVWLFMALVSFSNLEVQGVINWFKPIQQQAKLAQKPILLVINIESYLLRQHQQRMEFLDLFSIFADSVVLVPQLIGDSSAQALARLPQFLIDMFFRSGMINLDFADLSSRIQHGIAFFSYTHQQMLEIGYVDKISIIEEINKQWRSHHLRPASVKEMLASIEKNNQFDLDVYMTIGEQLQQPQKMFTLANNKALALGMSIKDYAMSENIHIGVLFFGLDFDAYTPVIDNLEE